MSTVCPFKIKGTNILRARGESQYQQKALKLGSKFFSFYLLISEVNTQVQTIRTVKKTKTCTYN